MDWMSELGAELEQLGRPIWIFDLEQRRMLWANTLGLRFWRADSVDGLRARDFASDMSEATASRLDGYKQRLMRNEVFTEQWTLYPGADSISVRCRISGVGMDGGQPAMRIDVIEDEFLRPDALRSVEAMRHTTAVISLFTPEGGLLMQNPAALRAYPWASAEPVPVDALSARFAEPGDAANARRALLGDAALYSGEVLMKTVQGERWHHVDARSTVDPVSGEQAVLVTETDVTPRLEREIELLRARRERSQALSAERNFIGAVLDTVGSLVVVADRAGHIVRVNEAVERLTDQDRRSLKGLEVWEVFDYPSPDEFQLWVNEPSAVPEEEREAQFASAAGELKLIVWTARALSGSGGQEHVILNGVDITDRREMQLRLQLSDRMASVGTLAAGVAHEMNNPLTYVIGSAELMLQELSRLGSESNRDVVEELRTLAEDCRGGARRLAGIVAELKSFARGSQDEIAPVQLRDVVDSALRMATHELRHRAQVERDEGDVPRVLANESKLSQVVLNLLVNAAQSIPEGDAQSNRITLRTHLCHDGRVCIRVEDSGHGIPPEHLERIFDPFFTTKPVGVGTGPIGLGATLALFCDLVLVADHARIGDPHVSAGIVAGDGGAILWPLLLGPHRGKEVLLLGDLMTAADAERLGMVNAVHPASELADAAEKLARRLATGPRTAIEFNKRLANTDIVDRVNRLLDTSLALEALTFETADHREAVQAFLEKRAPVFGKEG